MYGEGSLGWGLRGGVYKLGYSKAELGLLLLLKIGTVCVMYILTGRYGMLRVEYGQLVRNSIVI